MKLITAALPYANGAIHIGHLFEHIYADIYARFYRLKGEKVNFVSGSDMHGTPIEINARKKGIPAEDFAMEWHKKHAEIFRVFQISFDNFYNTHSEENREITLSMFQKLKENGHIYKKQIKTLFCGSCNRYLPDRFVKGTCPNCGVRDQYGDVCEACGLTLKGTDLINPFCVICKKTPSLTDSEHYFFRLSDFGEQLKRWYGKSELKEEVKNHITKWIEKGLDDWCISRDGPYFGFKIPNEENKYFYVWLDAPIGYISSLKNIKGDSYKEIWDNSKITHFIGKDIMYFHLLFWPAVLMGTGYKLPDDVPVHGFVTVNGTKMSKSRGTFFTAREFEKLYSPEYLRYYYATHLSNAQEDVNFDFEDFRSSVNNRLIANLGNFCYRVMSFSKKHYNGEVSEEFGMDISKETALIERHYAEKNIKAAMKEIFALCDKGNKYFQEREPWKNDDKAAVDTSCHLAFRLAVMIKPVLPSFSEEIEKQFGKQGLSWDVKVCKMKINEPKVVLQKIERLPSDFVFPARLIVGKILSVKDHPNADSLYLIDTDLGDYGKKQIVAGLKAYFSPEELNDKKVIVVSNLKPANIRGEKSEGMIIVAELQDEIKLLHPQKSRVGDVLKVEGFSTSNREITFEEFSRLAMGVHEGRVMWKEFPLHSDVEDIQIENMDGAMIR